MAVLCVGLSDEGCFWSDTPMRVGEEGWSPMTETLKGMSSMPKDATKTLKPGEVERTAVRELVKAARARGEDLTGPDGLLKSITKQVLEAALEGGDDRAPRPRETSRPSRWCRQCAQRDPAQDGPDRRLG